jgi:hypothetical protein
MSSGLTLNNSNPTFDLYAFASTTLLRPIENQIYIFFGFVSNLQSKANILSLNSSNNSFDSTRSVLKWSSTVYVFNSLTTFSISVFLVIVFTDACVFFALIWSYTTISAPNFFASQSSIGRSLKFIAFL